MSANHVTVDVLGPLRVRVAGAVADIGGPRQRAVLARLVAAGGHVVPTDRFVDDLWHGEPPPKALAALQVYVSNLRRVLEPGRAPRTPATVVVSAAPGYALRLPDEQVDAWRFEALLREGSELAEADPRAADRLLRAALDAWAGPAYAEFADEGWAGPEATRLEELRLAGVEAAGRVALRLGRAALVVPELDRHVQQHPLREAAVHVLATALYRAGRQADALAVLRQARDRLADELGVDPGPALRALEADVLAQADHLAADAAPAPGVTPAPARRPGAPVGPARAEAIGRDEELAALMSAALAVQDEGLRIVWLGGEAGAGKSTLARAFAAALADRGWPVAWGRCPEVDGAPPAWAWAEVLAGDAAAADGPGLDQFQLARAVSERLGAGGSLLVVLDDVHRADGETLQILRHVAVALAARAVLVVATLRTGEDQPQLQAARAALAGPRSTELLLGGLRADAAAQVLARHLGAPVDDAVAAVVHERTGGNPLFLAETARLISAEGAARAVRAIPAGIGHVLRRRLARLPAPAQTVLRHASILGRDVDIDVLASAFTEGEDAVLDGLEAGVLAGLLEEPAPGRVRFGHALLRDVLYDDMPQLRRRRLHERVLAVLERTSPHDVAALGHHALAAATPATALRAAGHASAAARQAAAAFAHREAAQLYAAALDALALHRPAAGEPADADGLRLDLLCGLASARANSGDMLGARTARWDAVQAAPGGDTIGRARALASFDAPVAWSIRVARGIDRPLVELLERTLARPALPPLLRARLLVALVYELEGDELARCDEASAEALRIARAEGDGPVLCQALNARYFAVLNPQRRHTLAAVGAELLEVAERAGLLGFQAQAHHVLYQAALERSDLALAQQHLDRALERSTAGQLGVTLSVMAILGAIRALFAGDHATAERIYTELGQRIEAAGQPNAALVSLIGVFFVRLTQGRAHTLLAMLEPLRTLPTAEAEAGELIARALVDAGRLDEARAAWRPDRPVREDYYWLAMTGLRGENAAALGDPVVAARCYEQLLPWAGQFVGLASGTAPGPPVDLVLGRLATVLGRPADAHFRAAADLAARTGATPWMQPRPGATPAT
ncbi:BTAD domain-containing putative transcriptional regulator [Dactylosporangium matsuzakiense]|uniref:BTAD domain-containing putative transcriptional regulator n=1 Tax=Dactylosporangium matsuzakiense TaxID=53360 RepID=UPI0021C38071|nr:BTAD domain-containing putative transcriptional regulator [Dactylosporangium matsuzakiense]UWZ49059.1 AAA family ATPase [Dactylosporangium matsuzakiense]